MKQETPSIREKFECMNTEELFQEALKGDPDCEVAWEAIAVLRLRGTKEVFEEARRYSLSENATARLEGRGWRYRGGTSARVTRSTG